ncbi:tetrahydrofolate synthase [Neptunitalea chrysea]|uniref:Dihydrofolate synthase/folylpolyglutamate synthase n=1 Tax=Neptunitalea chrysea TaxID=1647581 RepID=A0A9W6B5A4_9FLAO|nr:folylpolyglutamate synthase/dihydrofolate synthase family protein [Neptunitalea chrysea]GLB52839.1 tetrahydrofolate synthase [Neptunitalea chrysea]
MNYEETLHWLFTQLPMFQTQGKSALNNKLDNIVKFCSYLGSPERKFKSIHVAGTNGKGSSSHMMASVLQSAGYKVGLFTSPHLKDFRERIRINGKSVSEDMVVSFVAQNKPYFEANAMSFFEMTTGMAFQFFADEQVDVAVVEVGLGGRLDCTNVIIPEVSLITNIGLDHTDILGGTYEKIAFEKGGIIKEGVPCVVSEYQSETALVFEAVAKDKHTKIVYASEQLFKDYVLDLTGSYQERNIKGVLAVIKVLQGAFCVVEENIVDGLANVVKNTGLMGRWQVLHASPKVVCDTGHNKEGMAYVIEQLNVEEYNRLHMVLGFVQEKEIQGVLAMLPKDAVYYFTKPDTKRAISEIELQQQAKKFTLFGESYNSVQAAYSAAFEAAKEDDFIFVGGSNFVVAEII